MWIFHHVIVSEVRARRSLGRLSCRDCFVPRNDVFSICHAELV